MPGITLDTTDAAELAELLDFLAGWTASDPDRLAASLLGYVSHPAYNLDHLRDDLNRCAFLLGGNDRQHLLEPGHQ